MNENHMVQLLSEMESFRKTHQDSRQYPADYCMRVMEAIVAEKVGYHSRCEWADDITRGKGMTSLKDVLFWMQHMDGNGEYREAWIEIARTREKNPSDAVRMICDLAPSLIETVSLWMMSCTGPKWNGCNSALYVLKRIQSDCEEIFKKIG